MLTVVIPGEESYDESTQEFVYGESTTLKFEHSLISISEWEAKFEQAFLGSKDKTEEQIVEYINMMCLSGNLTQDVWNKFTQKTLDEIKDYISSKRSATWFPDEKKSSGVGETITSELVYYWMVANQIPKACEEWHFNRLINVIKVCSAKNQPEKKMSRSEIAARNSKLNAERKAQMQTSG